MSPARKKEETLVRGFLQECLQRTVDLCLAGRGLDNLERAKLFDIILSVSDIAAKLGFSIAQDAEPETGGYLAARASGA